MGPLYLKKFKEKDTSPIKPALWNAAGCSTNMGPGSYICTQNYPTIEGLKHRPVNGTIYNNLRTPKLKAVVDVVEKDRARG
jgi:hypothetical protein